MCGIAIRYKDAFLRPEKIVHRGIELAKLEVGHYSCYHTRLPLQTNQGDQWHQPIKLSTGAVLLYNGEIFNYPQEFDNDVEFLVDFFSDPHWMIKIRQGVISEWDGFWAICLVTEDQVYAITDPLGKKQLYYSKGAIASEIKPLLWETNFEPDFVRGKPRLGTKTPFKGVRRIIPNQLYIFNGDKMGKDVEAIGCDLRMKPPKGVGLKRLIEKACHDRMINRYDLNSVLVSGGLDSTIILQHLKEHPNWKNLDLLTISNDEDEEYIKIIEGWIGREVRRIDYHLPSVSDVIKVYEYPFDFGSMVAQYCLAEQAQGSVIYTGDGADELFSGYSRALRYDSQFFDIFVEIPYYHNIRLDRMSMAFTKEIRSPFLSHDLVRYAVHTPYLERIGKRQLKKAYRGHIPDQIIERKKNPLRIGSMRRDREQWQSSVNHMFNLIHFHK